MPKLDKPIMGTGAPLAQPTNPADRDDNLLLVFGGTDFWLAARRQLGQFEAGDPALAQAVADGNARLGRFAKNELKMPKALTPWQHAVKGKQPGYPFFLVDVHLHRFAPTALVSEAIQRTEDHPDIERVAYIEHEYVITDSPFVHMLALYAVPTQKAIDAALAKAGSK